MRVELRDSKNRLYGIFIPDENVIEIKRDGVIAQFDLSFIGSEPKLRPRAVFLPAPPNTIERPTRQTGTPGGSSGDPTGS